jgi:hypothetical protein
LFYGTNCENFGQLADSSSTAPYVPPVDKRELKFTLMGVVSDIVAFRPALATYLKNLFTGQDGFSMVAADNFEVTSVQLSGMGAWLPRVFRTRLTATYTKSVCTVLVNNNHGGSCACVCVCVWCVCCMPGL